MADEQTVGKAKHKTFRTPCGLSIAHVSKAETVFAYQEIFEDTNYFQHGIELRDEIACLTSRGHGLFTIFVHDSP